MLTVEQWAEIRAAALLKGLSIREIAGRTGRDRKTIGRALRSSRTEYAPQAGTGDLERRLVRYFPR